MLEEFGKGLMPEPLLSSVLLGGTAIQRGGSAAQRAELLPALIGGELLLALAYQERQQPLRSRRASRPAPSAPATAGACAARSAWCSTATSPTA